MGCFIATRCFVLQKMQRTDKRRFDLPEAFVDGIPDGLQRTGEVVRRILRGIGLFERRRRRAEFRATLT